MSRCMQLLIYLCFLFNFLKSIKMQNFIARNNEIFEKITIAIKELKTKNLSIIHSANNKTEKVIKNKFFSIFPEYLHIELDIAKESFESFTENFEANSFENAGVIVLVKNIQDELIKYQENSPGNISLVLNRSLNVLLFRLIEDFKSKSVFFVLFIDDYSFLKMFNNHTLLGIIKKKYFEFISFPEDMLNDNFGDDENVKLQQFYSRKRRIKEIIKELIEIDKQQIELKAIEKKINLLVEFSSCFYYQKKYEKAVQKLNDALVCLSIFKDGRLYGKIQYYLANINFYMKKYDISLEYYTESIKIFRKTRNRLLISNSYKRLGDFYYLIQDWGNALVQYKLAYSWKEISEISLGIGSVVASIGNVNFNLNNENDVIIHYERAVGWFIKTGDFFGVAKCYYNIALIYDEQKEWNESIKFYLKSVESYKEAKVFSSIGDSFYNIGFIYAEKKEWNNAIEFYQKAINWYENTRIVDNIDIVCNAIGRVYVEQKKWDKAILFFEKAIEYGKITKNYSGIGNSYHNIAFVYSEQRKWGNARDYYYKALFWKKRTFNIFEIASTYYNIGYLFLKQKRWNEAINFYNNAKIWSLKTDSFFELAAFYHQMGYIYTNKRRFDRAIKFYQKAIDWKNKTYNFAEIGNSYHQIAYVYSLQNNYFKAIKYYKKAVSWNMKTNNYSGIAISLLNIGTLYAKKREWTDSIDSYKESLEWYKKNKDIHNIGRVFFSIRQIILFKLNPKEIIDFYNDFLEENLDFKCIWAYAFHEIALVYKKLNNSEKELDFFNKALEYKRKYNVKFELGNTLYFLGDITMELKKALECYITAVEKMMENFEYTYIKVAVEKMKEIEIKCNDSKLIEKVNLLLDKYENLCLS